jgi:hypothetical protein
MAPGPNGIANEVYFKCADLLAPYLGPIFRGMFTFEIYPTDLQHYLTLVLRKPGRPDYRIPKAYQPIALLNCLGKILCACVALILVYAAEKYHMLPDMQFGGRAGCSTTDALHLITQRIKTAKCQGNVFAIMFLDLKAAFPSVVPSHLIYNMRMKGVPQVLTDWISWMLNGRMTLITFDGFTSDPQPVHSGLAQGCILSVILHHFYNTYCLKLPASQCKSVEGFIDNISYGCEAPTFQEAHEQLNALMTRPGGVLELARQHNHTFKISKTAIIDFTRKRINDPQRPRRTTPIQQPAATVNRTVIIPSTSHKHLGLILDQELQFQEHAAYAFAKGSRWVAQFQQLSHPSNGIPPKFARQLYLAVAVPKMLYAADVFCPLTVQKRKGTLQV